MNNYLSIVIFNCFMRLRFSFLIVLMAILSADVFAKPVDETTARIVATRFFANKYNRSIETLAPTVVYTSNILRGENTTPSFYVVNFDFEGFVIVAGDDRAQPILAFSDEGAFVTENIPAHISFFLNGYAEGIQYMIDNNQDNDAVVLQQWETLLSENAPLQKDGTVVVSPLILRNKWKQTRFYNNLCPEDATGNASYGGHAAVGCGALVMGQVMHYWRFPTTGTGSHSYNSNNYGSLSANFGATTYHYENMPDQLTTTNHPDSCVEAIATLLYHCGVAVNMNYGPSASVSNSNKIVSALSTYFRYPATVQYIERGSLSAATWLNYLKGELDEGAPFMYGGSGSYGGHVWICDGYRDDDYFHFNWGWGGQQNGYYALTSCSSYGFNDNHAIIIGIRGPELPVAIDECSAQNISVFPNPTNDILNITSSETISEIEIINVMGQIVKRVEVNADNATCNVEDLTNGVYVVRIRTLHHTEPTEVSEVEVSAKLNHLKFVKE